MILISWINTDFFSSQEIIKFQFELPLSNISVRSETLPLAVRDTLSQLSFEPLCQSEWKWTNEQIIGGWFLSPQHWNVSGMCLSCSASAEDVYVILACTWELTSPTDSKYLYAGEEKTQFTGIAVVFICSCNLIIEKFCWLWSSVSMLLQVNNVCLFACVLWWSSDLSRAYSCLWPSECWDSSGTSDCD